MAVNAQEAYRMATAAEEAGKILMVGMKWRFRPETLAARQAVEAGLIGDIYYAEAIGWQRRGIPGGTFIKKATAGAGALMDNGVYTLDTVLYIMGHPKPLSVSASAGAYFGKRTDVPWDANEFTVEDFGVGFVRLAGGITLFFGHAWAINFEDYWKMRALGIFSGGLLTGAMVLLAALALDVVLQRAMGRYSLPQPSAGRALLMAAASWGFIRLAGAIESWLPGDRFGAAEWQISGTGAWLAGFDVLAESFHASLIWVMLTGTVFSLASVLFGRARRIGWSLIIALAIGLSRSSSPLLVGFYSLAVLAAIGLIILFLRTSGPDLLSFAAAMFVLETAGRAAVLWQQPIAEYKLQAALAMAAAIVPLVAWAGYGRRRNQSKNFSPGLR